MSRSFSARKLLLPLAPAYRLALQLREMRLGTWLEPVRRLRFPVISIGNLSTGGAGKTPLTITLVRALTERGFQVDVLSRGYGRRSQMPAHVDSEGTAQEFGDEPLLIARQTGASVYVAGQRYKAGLLAEAAVPEDGEESRSPIAHILDDGFQHRQLVRDVDILLLDRRDWEDSLLPAGNLREPLQAVWRADVIAIPTDDLELEAELRDWGWEAPVWRLHRTMEVPASQVPVAAFCGIARPEQFFAGLQAAGLHLAARTVFRDHHPYTAVDLERLTSTARGAGAGKLLTTEKDLVRLGRLASGFPRSLPLQTAGLRVEIEHQDKAVRWLMGRLRLAPAQPPL